MKHLRDTHGIAVSGSSQKRKLRNIGYFHGYKGYRFNRSPANQIAYIDFNEILAMNEFDMAIKGLFYPQIMFIETALKNYVLEVVLDQVGTDSFNDVFENTGTGGLFQCKETVLCLRISIALEKVNFILGQGFSG